MENILLSLLSGIATVIVKAIAKEVTRYFIKRLKDRTALTANKDGSNKTN